MGICGGWGTLVQNRVRTQLYVHRENILEEEGGGGVDGFIEDETEVMEYGVIYES